MKKKEIVNPNLYSRNYFLTDNEGCNEYNKGLDENIHPKFKRALELANPLRGNTILDIGCGRGELVYYCARKGAKALGIDYSKAAIEIAEETIKKLPAKTRHLAKAEVGDIVNYDFEEKYDIIFMIEIAEHMYDWQLNQAFEKIKKILKNNGKLIIITPNCYYEKYLSPIKQTVAIPWNLIKIPLRILRDKYRPKGMNDVMRKIFRIKLDRGELNRMMHVNITTPGKLKNILRMFNVEIRCEDHSKNIISLIMRKWWGRNITLVATKKEDI